MAFQRQQPIRAVAEVRQQALLQGFRGAIPVSRRGFPSPTCCQTGRWPRRSHNLQPMNTAYSAPLLSTQTGRYSSPGVTGRAAVFNWSSTLALRARKETATLKERAGRSSRSQDRRQRHPDVAAPRADDASTLKDVTIHGGSAPVECDGNELAPYLSNSQESTIG